jgi:hypothetical protein
MPKVTVHVLAEDFKDNKYDNYNLNMDGCPLERAFLRAGIINEGISYSCHRGYVHLSESVPLLPWPDERVLDMFDGDIPIEDFSFDIEVG